MSYPARYGKYTEIIAHAYIYEFDLTGRIKFITGRGSEWPHGDWLKHTKGCNWVFYTAGEYSNIFPYTGEYYTPCLDYASNPFFPYTDLLKAGLLWMRSVRFTALLMN